MQYTGDKVEWWLERVKRNDYQAAYLKTAIEVKRLHGRVVVDTCCGNGELLKILNQESPGSRRLFVGTDKSPEMIELASRNLLEAGIPNRLIKKPEEISEGTNFIADNLTDSRLSASMADVAIFTFPELEINENSTMFKLFSRHGPASTHLMPELASTHCLARLVKRGGFVVRLDYATSQGQASQYDRNSRIEQQYVAESLGMRVLDIRFFEAPKMMGDLGERSGTSRKAKFGYTLSIYLKT